MIEWMQTHRKWLVITIWIATIAFIGAGFVGWGQFQFGRKSDVVAEVGKTQVTIKDVQNAYQNLFQQVNQQLGGNLDEATAKKLGLDKQALKLAIRQAMLREYAKNLGLIVTDDDVAKKILEYFKNKKTYETYLKNTGQKAKEFEDNLKKQLLIEKLFTFLHIKPSKTALLTMASALYNADNLNIDIINRDDIKVTLDEKEIKDYYLKHKNEFLSPKKYKLLLSVIPLNQKVDEKTLKSYYEEHKLNYKNEKGEILSFEKAKEKVKIDYLTHKLKKEAILAYKQLKESNGNFEVKTVTMQNSIIPIDKMQTLIKNGIVKPFVYNNKYISAKLIEEIKPTPLSFEKAKPLVTQVLLDKMVTKKLINTAEQKLVSFSGKNIGFVTKYDFNKIKNLPPSFAEEFLFKVFTKQTPKSVIYLPNKNTPKYAVLYKIKEQKLLEKDKYEKNKEAVYNLTESIINNELLNDLINYLSTKYKIVTYVKG